MKYTKILLLSFTFFVCGYTNYFISPEDSVEKFYGKNKLLNLVMGETTLNMLNSDLTCKGMYFISQPNNNVTEKSKVVPGIPFARVKCNDDRIFEIKWSLDKKVSAVDQQNKSYTLKQVKKKEYKKYIKPVKEKKNDKPAQI